jgi:hypothetical protein
MDFPTFPKDFSTDARNRVIAASVMADRVMPEAGACQDRDIVHNVMSVVEAFAMEACELGKSRTWAADKVHREVHEFRRLLTIRAEYRYGTSYGLQMVSAGTGELTREAERKLEATPQWSRYQDELLKINEPAGTSSSIAGVIADQLLRNAVRASGTPVIPPTEPRAKTISERLDDVAVHADITHDEQAHRIGISRTAYFEVKAGRGGRKSRRKVEIYLTHSKSLG